MTTLIAKKLTLRQVHELLHFEEQFDGSFTPWLSLEPLTDIEQQELDQIRQDFVAYLIDGKVLEGQIKLLVIGPLLRLAGFYRSPIKISLEQDIADIVIEDEDTTIKGRFDILSINKEQPIATDIAFWVLVIEAKNSSVNSFEGLPQLLTYAYKSLQHQELVWGLTTNGTDYRFVLLRQGNPPTYQHMPLLNLMDRESAIQLLQVLKAICKRQNSLGNG
ncbi:MAG TPA: restriction endonuclease subunit R [Cyanobacteria bacterium UBA12227]|nr:restriction endonuclease subunit R [Cyanobacteria bacterium UBA12227]HAX85855.1 restriction endonuclease subunit R [Cyanobacteria bacterium UBA11370]HBY76033.1 restriction endonuclease subunit R [Cyanobacteria bacterium UBA11148]